MGLCPLRACLVAHGPSKRTVRDKFRHVWWPGPFHEPACARTLKYSGLGLRGTAESAVFPEPPSRKAKSGSWSRAPAGGGDGARPKMVAGEIGLTALDLPPLFHPSPLTAETPATISPFSSFIDDEQVSGGTFTPVGGGQRPAAGSFFIELGEQTTAVDATMPVSTLQP